MKYLIIAALLIAPIAQAKEATLTIPQARALGWDVGEATAYSNCPHTSITDEVMFILNWHRNLPDDSPIKLPFYEEYVKAYQSILGLTPQQADHLYNLGIRLNLTNYKRCESALNLYGENGVNNKGMLKYEENPKVFNKPIGEEK